MVFKIVWNVLACLQFLGIVLHLFRFMLNVFKFKSNLFLNSFQVVLG